MRYKPSEQDMREVHNFLIKALAVLTTVVLAVVYGFYDVKALTYFSLRFFMSSFFVGVVAFIVGKFLKLKVRMIDSFIVGVLGYFASFFILRSVDSSLAVAFWVSFPMSFILYMIFARAYSHFENIINQDEYFKGEQKEIVIFLSVIYGIQAAAFFIGLYLQSIN